MLRRLHTTLLLLAVGPAALWGQASGGSPIRISYGAEGTSFGELLLPPGAGPFPVAVLLHGGCWLATRSSLADMRPMAAILAQHGIASWNVEYRRVGHPGGGWPGTFRDLADATDFVRELAPRYPIDTQRTILVGHSSGGYLPVGLREEATFLRTAR